MLHALGAASCIFDFVVGLKTVKQNLFNWMRQDKADTIYHTHT